MVAAPPAAAAPFTISGTVFEDVNYGGGTGRGPVAASGIGRPGTRVELYDAAGMYVTFTTTGASGGYTFGGLAAGTYTVRVVNVSVSSSRTSYVAGTHLAVQTFRTDASGGTPQPVSDHVGGQDPGVGDAPNGKSGANLNTLSGVFLSGITGTAQSITTVALSGDVPAVDFGFSFDVVVNKNNAGQGSLRQFLTNANALANSGLAQTGRPAGIDNAIFMLADGTVRPGLQAEYPSQFTGGVASIALASALPTITSPVVVDAQTQPGWAGAPKLELNGAGAGDRVGWTIDGGGTTVRGFVINRFKKHGIAITGGGSNTIGGNYLGTNAAGTTASPNEKDGIYIDGSPGNVIGGNTPADRNVISGNGWVGIEITGVAAIGNQIRGNYVGLDAAGTIAIRNANDGIDVTGGATNTIIGGTAPGAGNVISGNNTATMDGIWLSSSSGTTVQGNKIGTNAAGTAALPNARAGVYVLGSSDNAIGGTSPGAGNLIAYNDSVGVIVSGSSLRNAILGNSISGNRRLGLDLGSNGVTANDGTKGASLANGGMDFPVLTGAVIQGSTLEVAGWIGTARGQSVFAGAHVEVFQADGEASGYGEGQTLVGSVTADASGAFYGSFPVSGLAAGDRVTATATDGSGNTSEFGPDGAIGATPLADLALAMAVNETAPHEWDALTFELRLVNHGPSTATSVQVDDPLPAGLGYVSSSARQGAYAPATGRWTVGSLSATDTASLTIVARVLGSTAGTKLVNAATATATEPDPIPSDNAAAVTDTVRLWGARLETGTYVGNGFASRAVTGLGFRPDFVLVKATGASGAVMTTSTLVAAGSKELGPGSAPQPNRITSIGGDGFSVGSHASVNAAGVTYAWVGARTAPGVMAVGTYVGDGNNNRVVAGLGFQASYLMVMGEGATLAIQKFANQDDNALPFSPDNENSSWLKTLNPDGFTTGSGHETNRDGSIYHYVAWKALENAMSAGTYLGDETDSRAITGAGFEPEFVLVKSAKSEQGVHRAAAPAGDATLPFASGSSFPDGIQRLLTDGLEIGADFTVNKDNDDYYWAAFRDFPPPALADLEVSIGVDETHPLRGDTLTYSVTVRNHGVDPASGVSVVSVLPSELSHVTDAPSQGTYAPATGVWSVGSLANGAAATLTLLARVSPVSAGGALTHAASISLADQVDPVDGNNLDSVTVTVETSWIRLVTGRYVGDGAGSRAITGLGFQPDLVIVRSSDPRATVATTTTMVASGAKALGVAAAPQRDRITSLDTDQFTVGSDSTVNAPGGEYTWAAFRAAKGKLAVGSYVGDGTSSRSIAGIGFQPSYAVVLSGAGGEAIQRFETQGVKKSVAFSARTEITNGITGFDPEGFEVGSAAEANQAGVTYHYAVWKASPTEVSVTNYAGNGADDRAIGDAGFQPQFVIVKAESAEVAVHRGASLSGDQTLPFPPSARREDGIQTFLPGGFQVGAANEVNTNGTGYHAVAFRDSATALGADLVVSQVVDLANPMESSTVHFTVTLEHRGPDLATGVAVTSLLPAGLTYRASARSQGTYTPGSGTWTIGNLGSGDVARLTLTASVNAGTLGATLTSVATVTAVDQPDLDPGNESASAGVTVRAPMSLVVAGDTSSAQVQPPVANQIAWLHTVSPGANRLLVVGVSFLRLGSDSIAGLTYAGQPLSRVRAGFSTGGSAGDRSEIWALLAPPVGTAPVLVTFSGNDSIASAVGGAVSFTHVDQAAPFGMAADSGGALGVPRASVTSRPVDLVFATLATRADHSNAVAPTTGQSELWNRQTGPPAADATLGAASRSEGSPAVEVAWETAAPEPWALAAVAIQPVLGFTDLAVAVAASPGTVNQGDSVRFTVTLTNHGPDPATNIVVRDSLLAELDYVSDTPSQGSYSPSTGTWTAGSLGVGSVATLEIIAAVARGLGGVTLPHVASIVSRSQNDSVTSNDRDSVGVRVRSADLALGIVASDATPNVGDTLIVTVSLSNAGPDTATGVAVADRLPAGLTYVSHAASQGAYAPATGFWTAGSLANGTSATLQIAARIDAATGGTVLADTAWVAASNPADPVTANDTAMVAVTAQSADLGVDVAADPLTPTVGDTVRYTVTVKNHGPTAASGIVVTDRLPAGLTYLANAPTQGSYVAGSGAWMVGALPPDSAASLVLTARVEAAAAGATLADTAVIAAATPDTVAANNSSTVAITVQSADLSVTMAVSNPAPDERSVITWTITLSNGGPHPANAIRVLDALPPGMTLDQATASDGSYDSGAGVWSVGHLAAAAVATLRLNVTVDAGTAGSTLTNLAALLSAGTFDPDAANDRDSLSVVPVPAGTSGISDLDLSKTASSSAPDEGDTLIYVVTLANQGPDPASGVEVTAVLPAGTTYRSHAAGQGSYDSASGVWAVGGLANSAVTTLTLQATVDAGTGGSTLAFDASVSSLVQSDSVTANNSATASVTVTLADLGVGLAVDDNSPNEGDTLHYTLTIENHGPSPSTGISVMIHVPAGLVYVSDSPSQGAYASGTGVWSVGSLALGAMATLTLVARVAAGTAGATIADTARVLVAEQADSVSANDVAVATIRVQSADLAVSIVVDRPVANQGDAVVYTVTVSNNGPDAATGVIVRDRLPVGLNYQTDVAGQGTYDRITGMWTVGTIGSSGLATLTLSAVVDAGAGGVTITNLASVFAADQADPDVTNGSDSTGLRLTSADLAVALVIDDAAPNAGDTLTYRVTLTNLGPDAATGIFVLDRLPAGLTYLSHAAGAGAYTPATGAWTLASLAAGDSASLDLLATVDPAAVGSTVIDTAAIVDADQADPVPGNDTATRAVTVQSADLAVALVVSDAAPNAGDTLAYRVTLTNLGPDGATGITVLDRLPAGLTYLSHAAGAGAYTPATGAWTLASLAAGDSASLDLLATVDPAAATTITDTAAIVAADQADPVAGNDTAMQSVTVRSADLAVALVVSDAAPNAGDTLIYRVTLTNLGPDAATGIFVLDRLPAGLTYLSHAAGAGAYTPATGAWTLASLAAGDSASLDLLATVDPAAVGSTVIDTAAIVAADQADPVAGNDTAMQSVTVRSADLAVALVVSDAAPNAGDTLIYRVTLRNLGPDGATGITVLDRLPAGLTYLSHAAGAGAYTPATGAWTLASLAAGDSASLDLLATVDPAAATTITDTAAIVAADQADPVAGNDTAMQSVTVRSADLAVALVVSDAAPNAGDTLIYRVTLRNLGPDGATGITVLDRLPAGLTYLSHAAGAGAYTPATGAWTLASLAAGDSASLDLLATVDPAAATTITDTAAIVAADQADPVAGNDTAMQSVTVRSADLAVALVVSDAAPNAGDTLAYRVTLTNLGPDAATGITVLDRLPAGLTYLSHAAGAGVYAAVTSAWALPSLAAGDSASLDLLATVDPAAVGSTIIDTAAIVAADQADPVAGNDTAMQSVTVRSADLAVALVVSDAAPNAGDTLIYRVTLRNLGPDAATGIFVLDRLPAGLTYLSHAAGAGAYTPATGAWTLASLAAGDSASLDLLATVDPAAATTITDTAAIVAADQADPVAGNDTAMQSVTVRSADLAVALVVSDAAPNAGDTLAYRATLTNLGPDGATGITVLDRLPAGLTYLSHAAGAGAYTPATGAWTPASLAAGDSASLDLLATVDPAAATTITDTAAIVAADQADPVAGNDTAMQSVTVRSADLEVTLSVDRPAPREGDTIAFIVGVANHGPDLATLVRVTNLLPAGLTFQTGMATVGAYDSTTGVWTVASMGVSSRDTLRIVATVDGGTAGTTLRDSARVTAREADPRLESNAAFVDVRCTLPATVDARAADQSSVTLDPSGRSIEVLRIPLINRGSASITLDAVTLTNRTTGPGTQAQLDSEWQPVSVQVVRPASSHPVTAAPALAADPSASFVNGRARLSNLLAAIAPGDSLVLSFQGGASAMARDGDVLDLELTSAADLEFSEPVDMAGAWPLSPPGSFAVDGMSAAQIVVEDVGGSLFQSGSKRNLVFAAILPANGYAPDVLQKLNVVNQGSARFATDLELLELWRDADGNGAFDPGADARLGVMEFTGDRWEVTGLAVPVPAAGLRVFVSCDVSETAIEGRTLRFSLPGPPDPGVGMASQNDGPNDVGVQGTSIQTISAADRMILTALPLPSGTVLAGTRDVPLLQIHAVNSHAAPRVLTALTVTNVTSGGGSPAQRDNEITQIKLRLDGDRDGILEDLATDPLLGTTFFSGGRGTFTGLNWSLAPGAPADLFVLADVAVAAAADGDVLGAAVEDASAVSFTEDATLAANWPLDSGARRTIDGMGAVQIANLGAPVATLGRGDGPRLALDVILPRNGYANDVLERVQLVNAGTATPANLSDVRLWRDGGDGAFDAGAGDDRDLGPMAFAGGRWTSLPLAEALGTGGARVFASITTPPTVTDSATVQLRIPLRGIQVLSANDGPIDTTVTNPDELRLSNSELLATAELSPAGSTVGQTVTARLRVKNTGAATIGSIVPAPLSQLGDGALTALSGPTPPSLDLAPGAEGTFEWSLSAAAAGSVHARASAAGTEQGSGRTIVSTLAKSNLLHISLQAQALDIFSTGSLPFTINRGQTQVVPLSLTLTNPGSADAADIRLRRLVVRLEDASGAPIVPSALLSRAVINEGTRVYLDRTALESSGSTIDLALAEPVFIESGGESRRQATLSLSFDILGSTVVPSFRAVIVDETSFLAEDANTGTPVSIRLDAGQSYPLRSGLARIVAEATRLDVAAVAAAPATAGRGQPDLSLLDLDLLNPGPGGVGSDVRLGALSAVLLDSTGVAVSDPTTVLRRIQVRSGPKILLDRIPLAESDSTIALVFASLLSIPVATPTPLSITASISETAPFGRYRLRLADSATVDARDANSGAPLPALYGTPAVQGAEVTIQERADSVYAHRVTQFPALVPVGSSDVAAMTIVLTHPGTANTAGIECRSVTFRCRGPLDQPLVPSVFVDAARVLQAGAEVGRLTDLPAAGSSFTVPLSGVVVGPGEMAALELRLDLQVTAPAVQFEVDAIATGISARDVNLGSDVVVTTNAGAEFPLRSGLTQLQAPARQLLAGFTSDLPIVLASDGTTVPAARLTLRNAAPPTSGPIQVDHLDLIAADRGLAPLAIAGAVTAVEAWVADTLWAGSGGLSPGTASARLTAATPLELEAGQSVAVALRLTLRVGATVPSLRVGCVADGIGVRQPESALLSIAVLAEAGQQFPFWTEAGNFSGLSLRESYSNFPNPFAAGRERTRFVFYLREPASVSLRLLTSRGETIRSVLDGTALAAGLHQEVDWDGKNGSGHTVFNGTYVAELDVRYAGGTRERLLRKLAVVR